MIFGIGVIVSIVLAVLAGFFGVSLNDKKGLVAGLIGTVAFLSLAFWLQTHRIIPTQYVGVTKNSINQNLSPAQSAGIVKKPLLGSVYTFPASNELQQCETYTPAIKGSYGIVLDVCFYYNTGTVDWVKEINSTGSLQSDKIMEVWRTSVVGAIAASVNSFTPEDMSKRRSEVETNIYTNVNPWFSERGIELTRISFKNWDFSSEEVGKAYDESIVSQRKIAEQEALFEASVISRERETYEAETARIVAETQGDAIQQLGFEGQTAMEYLWMKFFEEQGSVPSVFVIGNSEADLAVQP